MLAVRLDPVQTKGMQERRQALHQTQNAQCQAEPRRTNEYTDDDPHDARHILDNGNCHVPQHFGQLSMCEGQCPETEVRRRVGDTPKAELDGVDDLVDDDFGEFFFLLAFVLLLWGSGSERDGYKGG